MIQLLPVNGLKIFAPVRMKLTPNGWVAKVAYCLLFILTLHSSSFAEGSKELSTNGGYRAALFSSAMGNNSFPFPTLGTLKVYAKVGETINMGSSVQGMGGGTINMRAPDGKTYTSGSDTVRGLIANRTQEVAGPLPGSGGYTPFTVKVQDGQQGVWEIDFISVKGSDDGRPLPTRAAAEWTQVAGGAYILAFDVSVRDAADTKFLTGRVFTNVFLGLLGDFAVGFNGKFDILTSDGYQYKLDNNGQAGNGFSFFVNNKGFKNADGTPSYKSVDSLGNQNVQDPRAPDTQADITQKIFFNVPAADLPATANTPGGGTTWLLKPPVTASLGKVVFTGVEGTVGRAGTSPLGGNFSFTSSVAGSYSIIIDADRNGIYTDPVDRKLTGPVVAGNNQIFWDGLDGTGKKITPGWMANYNSTITLSIKAGEVHFPFFDVERNVNGIKLTRLNGSYAPDDTLYWDDTQITVVGTPPNPVKNLAGVSSAINGHKWGSPNSDPMNDMDFGNNKSIDTWSYISNPSVTTSAGFDLEEADLEVPELHSVAGCAGKPVTYVFTVKNNGPDDVAGANVRFTFPAALTDVIVSSAVTAGASSVSGGGLAAGSYNTNINIANGAVRTFTVKAVIPASATGSLSVTASILRPADITDPDATNPDAAAPTDPENECNSSPSGQGCNNIKVNVTTFETASGAGADQTVIQYATAQLNGSGAGTWSQATGDPAVAVITDSTNPATTVTGLNNIGVYHFVLTNAGGCTDTVAVAVEEAKTVIPNIFTPNGDGKNDTFTIAGLEDFPGSQLMIFNRWGNEVYKADNYLNNWNGSDLSEGTYYYILNRKDVKGGVVNFKGWVFLKRSR